MDRQQYERKEARTGNSGFAKKRVQWLIEHSTSHQLLCYVDSLVLRNPLLRKAAKRYWQGLTNWQQNNFITVNNDIFRIIIKYKRIKSYHFY